MYRRNTSGNTGRCGLIVPALAFLLLALALSTPSIAQKADRISPVRFAGIAPGNAFNGVSKIVADPEVTITTAGCSVVGFTFSVLPKGDYIYGPFKTEGHRLRQEQVDELKKMKGTSMKIFLENIKLKCGDKTLLETPVVYDVKP
ncbi:MAG: hypothetical protein KF744_00215 [Taibaiella sp.]|nr:hypothetical protein [Taibaiella sp.]